MKKWMIAFMLVAAGCQRCEDVLKIAATPTPHAQILAQVVPELKKEGICLKIMEVDDYVLPNRLLAEHQVDANFFQHLPFLEMQEKQFGYHFEVLTAVHSEPLGIYSKKIGLLAQLSCGDSVAIPSDPTNGARALQLLEKEKLLVLTASRECPSRFDILENPLNLKIEEIDAPFLARVLPDVTLAVIPGNFALQAGLGLKDALALEPKDSPYANIVVIQEGDRRASLQKLRAALVSSKTQEWIRAEYHDSILPAL